MTNHKDTIVEPSTNFPFDLLNLSNVSNKTETINVSKHPNSLIYPQKAQSRDVIKFQITFLRILVTNVKNLNFILILNKWMLFLFIQNQKIIMMIQNYRPGDKV